MVVYKVKSVEFSEVIEQEGEDLRSDCLLLYIKLVVLPRGESRKLKPKS